MIINRYYPGEPVNIHMKALINIIQENNWVIPPKKGKGQLPIFCGNGERVNPIYDWVMVVGVPQEGAGQEVLGTSIQALLAFFCEDDGLVPLPERASIQGAFDALTVLFERVGI